MSTPKPVAALTARENELLTIAFQCLKSKPDVRISPEIPITAITGATFF
jgi:hypothetical protein